MIGVGAQITAKCPYAGQLCSRTYVLKVNGQASAPPGVTRDGRPVPGVSASAFSGTSEGWYFDAATGTVWVTFPLDSSVRTTVAL